MQRHNSIKNILAGVGAFAVVMTSLVVLSLSFNNRGNITGSLTNVDETQDQISSGIDENKNTIIVVVQDSRRYFSKPYSFSFLKHAPPPKKEFFKLLDDESKDYDAVYAERFGYNFKNYIMGNPPWNKMIFDQLSDTQYTITEDSQSIDESYDIPYFACMNSKNQIVKEGKTFTIDRLPIKNTETITCTFYNCPRKDHGCKPLNQ